MKRPEFFNEIIGHEWLKTYLQENLSKGSLHHFLILAGPEGLGKTAIADIIALSLVYGQNDSERRHKAYKDIVTTNRSNDNIKRFACSVEGGKDAARLIKDEMASTFGLVGPKVIICDECHGLSDAAQDVFLQDTEFIPDNVYVIMMTTELSRLKASLRSRAVTLHLKPLKNADMITLLRKEATAKNLNIQNAEAMYQMIANWAECKPRAGLNILNAFTNGQSVSSDLIREMIGYLDIEDVLPLLTSLSGSMTFGLSYIQEMIVSNSLINAVIECISIKSGQGSYKVKYGSLVRIREELSDVSVEQLTKFLYGITKNHTISRIDIINAFVSAHNNSKVLTDSNPVEVLASENVQRATHSLELEHASEAKAPTLDDLLRSSQIIT